MPMNFLEQIATSEMPYITDDPDEIERLRVLHQAGHVLCQLPQRSGRGPHCAIVHEVTALGQKMLRHFGSKSRR